MQPRNPNTPLAFRADSQTFVGLIENARDTARCVAPGLDGPKARALAVAARLGVDVRVVLNLSEETERYGYGTLHAVDVLRHAGVEVRQLRGNAVGFILADGAGYLFFPEIRMIAEE